MRRKIEVGFWAPSYCVAVGFAAGSAHQHGTAMLIAILGLYIYLIWFSPREITRLTPVRAGIRPKDSGLL